VIWSVALLAYASLITLSPESAAAVVAACRIESAALLTASAHGVHTLVAELVRCRTMSGADIDAVIGRAVTCKGLADERARLFRSIEKCG
jgi:hypothetical protein